MGLFDKLRGSDKSKQQQTVNTMEVECPHTALLPRWDSIDDIGNEERATHYYCEACGETFSPEEARAFAGNAEKVMSLPDEVDPEPGQAPG